MKSFSEALLVSPKNSRVALPNAASADDSITDPALPRRAVVRRTIPRMSMGLVVYRRDVRGAAR